MEQKLKYEKIEVEESSEELISWQRFPDHFGHTHVVPHQPRHVHVISYACWCEPFYEKDNQDPRREIWTHNQVH